eukprot:4103816-Pleurochrysis_carterae.AAC.1
MNELASMQALAHAAPLSARVRACTQATGCMQARRAEGGLPRVVESGSSDIAGALGARCMRAPVATSSATNNLRRSRNAPD